MAHSSFASGEMKDYFLYCYPTNKTISWVWAPRRDARHIRITLQMQNTAAHVNLLCIHYNLRHSAYYEEDAFAPSQTMVY